MNIRPCPDKAPCIGDDPIANYSTEAADPQEFIGFGWPWIPDNPINGSTTIDGNTTPPAWFSAGCLSICQSFLSQEDADLCAGRAAFACSHAVAPLFSNSLQVCNFTCPDGSIYTYHVFPGSFVETSQAAADEQAAAYACQQVGRTQICLSSIDNPCLGESYNQAITPLGKGLPPFVFTLVSGSLPPGLDIDLTSSVAALITGTPTSTGDYTFRMRITDNRGDFMERNYTLSAIGITNSPTPATLGSAYSFQYTASGGTPPYTFAIDAGTLPAGLSMSSTGLISGIPSTSGTSNFTVEVSDSA